jgi:hypothetical protein
MGEYADMIINGESCQECGAYLGEAVGYPRTCRSCKPAGGSNGHLRTLIVAKTNCPTCNKRVKKAGLADHMRDAHGVKP